MRTEATDPQEFPHVRFPGSVDAILRAAPAPAYVIDLDLLEANLRILEEIKKQAGCRILLAQKGFSAWRTYSTIARYLDGACASSVDEARLAREEMKREVHAYAPAWTESEVDALLPLCNHLLFNSTGQLAQYAARVRESAPAIEIGLRVNPEHREGEVALYDPCAPGSRLGATAAELEGADLSAVSGLHFHTLCESDADALARTLTAFEAKFARWIPGMRWVNFGGGHHITREGYDRDLLVRLIREFRARWNVAVYLEPGEAVALNAGVLVATVLDVLEREEPVAILDISATAHMPDVLEMPYRPTILGAGHPGEKAWTGILGGLTCLAGDVIGTYSFAQPLRPGDRLLFGDMAHYTMVKSTTFNGVPHPRICHFSQSRGLEVVREFGYDDFKQRLG